MQHSHQTLIKQSLLSTCIAFAGLLCMNVVHAQTDAVIRKAFEQYNINDDENLDGIEVDACKCIAFDTNGDKEVSFKEFKTAYKAGKRTVAGSNTNSSTGTSNLPPKKPVTATSVSTGQLQKATGESAAAYLHRVLAFGKSKGWKALIQEGILSS